ncbi:MAG: VWA domain-containing protein [Armatimonadetes bacterium]|nr:VWA domain-containing protein [Armatimonadota bacterium]
MHGYFTWNNPAVLQLLWFALLLVWIVFRAAGKRQAALGAFLQDRFRPADWRWHRRLRLLKGLLLVAAMCLLVIAAARPKLGTEVQKIPARGADVVFILDTSDSMLAQDVKPSRLEAAKQAALALINRLQGDRIGIVVFAGSAYMYSPLTIDPDAAAMFVTSIERGSAPAPGTALGGALASAVRLLEKAEYKYRAIVLFSDGEDHEGFTLNDVKQVRAKGIQIHVVALGSTEGAPIPVEEVQREKTDPARDPLGMFSELFGDDDGPRTVKSRFKQDRNGEIVITRMNEKVLAEIAKEGGGVFVRSSESGINIDRVYQAIASLESAEVGSYQFTRYAERFQWPLGLAVLLLVIESLLPAAPRRGPRERNHV